MVKESVPARPVGQDGAYVEGTQDGFWAEYPSHGAYTDISYFKEFKPFHRATMTKEAVPTTVYLSETPPAKESGSIGVALADGTYIADGSVKADGLAP
jgi:hypothetical protein